MDRMPVYYGELSKDEKLEVYPTAIFIVQLFLKDASADYILNLAAQLMVLGLHKKGTSEPDRVIADVGDTVIHAYSNFKAFAREHFKG